MKQENWLSRSELLLGSENIGKLKNTSVLVVGLGGVGGFVTEFLARQGIGKLTIADGDVVSLTNINRQIIALNSSIGQYKTELVAKRIKDINPEIELNVITKFLEPNDFSSLLSERYDFVVDCIDSISPKVALILSAMEKQIPLVSSMGAGGRLDVSQVFVKDISKTRNCHLAKNIRKRIKAITGKQAKGFFAVYSEELADENAMELTDGSDYKKSYYGTTSFMPAVFGLYAAAFVIKQITV